MLTDYLFSSLGGMAKPGISASHYLTRAAAITVSVVTDESSSSVSSGLDAAIVFMMSAEDRAMPFSAAKTTISLAVVQDFTASANSGSDFSLSKNA